MIRLLHWTTRGAFVAALAVLAAACGESNPTAPMPAAPYSQTDIRTGGGVEATTGKRLSVHYTGWLFNPSRPEQKGIQIDTSIGRSEFMFVLGVGQVIPGWDTGVPGMRVGGLRRLVLPPDLAYGRAGAGNVVPPNATLVFDIELLDVQ